MLGPAFVAAVAYIDPGNFATNIRAGQQSGYKLLWVVFAASLAAMPIQYLTAKLGIVTGRTLPELCRERFGPRFSVLMWIQAEIVAMATDLAEFGGAVIGLNLLFGLRIPVGVTVTAIAAFVIVALQSLGYRKFEVAIAALLLVVFIGFLYEMLRVRPELTGMFSGMTFGFGAKDTVLLGVGIIGATIMPHVIYLHSDLVKRQVAGGNEEQRGRSLRYERIDVVAALSVAGLINMSMLALAAELPHTVGSPVTLAHTHSEITNALGGGAALIFAAALFASGISSSSVGTLSGQVVMQGLLNLRIPLLLRRTLAMLPAVVLLTSGFDPTEAIVLSQVLLSFGIPFALIPLLWLGSRRTVMGPHATRPLPLTGMCVIATAIISLNVLLLAKQFV